MPNQYGFKPADSCINQLLYMTHEIYNLLDDRLDGGSVFLDISKAFDKFWLKGLLFKLSQNNISGNLSDHLSSFLSERKKDLFLTVKMSPQAFLKVLFWDHCYF